MSDMAKRLCPACGADVHGRKDKVYCSKGCGRRAWQRRYYQRDPEKNLKRQRIIRQRRSLQQFTHGYLTLTEQLKERAQ